MSAYVVICMSVRNANFMFLGWAGRAISERESKRLHINYDFTFKLCMRGVVTLGHKTSNVNYEFKFFKALQYRFFLFRYYHNNRICFGRRRRFCGIYCVSAQDEEVENEVIYRIYFELKFSFLRPLRLIRICPHNFCMAIALT